MQQIDPDVLRQMKHVARSLWGPGRRWTPGEIAWSVLTDDDQQVCFVRDGFCWLQPGYAVVLATDASSAAAVLELVDDRPLQVQRGDTLLRGIVRERGAIELTDEPFDLDVRLRTDEAHALTTPSGYRVRSATPDDDLVAVHQMGWNPVQLPFAPAQRPDIAADATSSFEAATLAKVQADEDYRLDLHIVAEASDGSLAGSCIGWFDAATTVTAIEPLSVHPSHRNLGLAGAMCLEVARQARALGSSEIVIHPRGDAAYPAPRGAYMRAGFRPVDRTEVYALGRRPRRRR